VPCALARLRRRSSHLGVSRGDLGVHPRCSDRSSAFRKGKAADAARVTYLAYGRSTSAELASRMDTKVSHDDTVDRKASRWCECGRRSRPSPQSCWCVRSGSVSAFPAVALPSRRRSRPARCGRPFGDGDGDGDKPAAEAALLRRLDPHEPQGWEESSVPTLEASSAQVERPQAK